VILVQVQSGPDTITKIQCRVEALSLQVVVRLSTSTGVMIFGSSRSTQRITGKVTMSTLRSSDIECTRTPKDAYIYSSIIVAPSPVCDHFVEAFPQALSLELHRCSTTCWLYHNISKEELDGFHSYPRYLSMSSCSQSQYVLGT